MTKMCIIFIKNNISVKISDAFFKYQYLFLIKLVSPILKEKKTILNKK